MRRTTGRLPPLVPPLGRLHGLPSRLRGTAVTWGLKVAAATPLTADVRKLVLTTTDGSALPSFTPGSHIAVECGDGRRNAYSLTGPGVEPDHYAISVRLAADGRGGSRWLHEIAVGQPVSVSAPRSDFPPVLTAR